MEQLRGTFVSVEAGWKPKKLLAQGIALGIIAINKTPCKGKRIVYSLLL